MKFCLKCNKRADSEMAIFCTECGNKLIKKKNPENCPFCGMLKGPFDKFCQECGNPIIVKI